jgi:hypothetical protein
MLGKQQQQNNRSIILLQKRAKLKSSFFFVKINFYARTRKKTRETKNKYNN